METERDEWELTSMVRHSFGPDPVDLSPVPVRINPSSTHSGVTVVCSQQSTRYLLGSRPRRHGKSLRINNTSVSTVVRDSTLSRTSLN